MQVCSAGAGNCEETFWPLTRLLALCPFSPVLPVAGVGNAVPGKEHLLRVVTCSRSVLFPA